MRTYFLVIIYEWSIMNWEEFYQEKIPNSKQKPGCRSWWRWYGSDSKKPIQIKTDGKKWLNYFYESITSWCAQWNWIRIQIIIKEYLFLDYDYWSEVLILLWIIFMKNFKRYIIKVMICIFFTIFLCELIILIKTK